MAAFSHLLDASVYSQPVRRSIHPGVAARWASVTPQTVAISAICEAEVLYGLRKFGSPQMREAYDSILQGRFSVLPVNEEVAATYADLRCDCEQAGITVQALDLLIAATAKTHGLIVATLNVKHFARIPGLAVEDWSSPPPT
ncbi:MAG: type II toxin-antitoxin system VapC family toxin [Opitutae bacterium]|nr:type II toxin-antitoxin system VapC family toxin [Opitutae bacterium]